MFKEELNLINKAETDADALRKEAKQEAKAMIEKANTNAGELLEDAKEKLGNEGSYKVKQTAVSSPSASSTTNAFIDTISQDTNGVIKPTKKM